MEPGKPLTPEEIERARLEIERGRLELEKAKSESAKGFFGRLSPILIPAAVSFAAVVVSLGQVWVTKISKDTELELAAAQKSLELRMQDAQRKRELDINAAKFVTENRQAIFNGTQEEQELFASLIATLFPIEVSGPLLRRLQRASPTSAKQTWQKAMEASASAAAAFSPDGRLFVTLDQDGAQVRDAETGKLLVSMRGTEPLIGVQFSPDGKRLLTQSLGGRTQVWDLATGRLMVDSSK